MKVSEIMDLISRALRNPLPRLEYWVIFGRYIYGEVYGHPDIPDGRYIAIGPVKSLIAGTEDMSYLLEKPEPRNVKS